VNARKKPLSPLAAQLARAYDNRTPVNTRPEQGPADQTAAYAAQRDVWRLLVGETRPVAWKVGAPARAVEPSAAPIFPQRLAIGLARLPAEMFFGAGIEAEIAFRFGRDLPARARTYSREEILDAIAGAHVAMELVDTRLADAEAAGPLWRLADNLLNGGLVIGDEIAGWRDLDFSALTARVFADGELIAETVGRPPLDDLVFCLPWWIGHVGGARAGDIVTTGAWNGMHKVGMPVDALVEFVGVGTARARIG
jgi:2-keto-4-pentenoate hydratase